MTDTLIHKNIDETVKQLNIVQRLALYVVAGHKKDKFMKGAEADSTGIFKQTLHTVLMTPDIDKVFIESIGKNLLVCTMKRIEGNRWSYEVVNESEDE